MKTNNIYSNTLFDDVIHYQAPKRLWQSANGEQELENEDSVDAEGEEAMVDGEFTDQELPKFRQLVRAKKLEMKAQYGKAHFATRRECKNVPYPGTCYKQVCAFGKCTNVPYPCTKYKEVCINVPYWVWGWRKKWREFKKAGGLSQLKMISKGMADISSVLGSPTLPPSIPSDFSPPTEKGKAGNEIEPNINLGNETITSKAGVGGNIIGTILILGLVFGAIKMMK